jgi:hypothetical protein
MVKILSFSECLQTECTKFRVNIVPAFTKHAVLTDDDDGQHVGRASHQVSLVCVWQPDNAHTQISRKSPGKKVTDNSACQEKYLRELSVSPVQYFTGAKSLPWVWGIPQGLVKKWGISEQQEWFSQGLMAYGGNILELEVNIFFFLRAQLTNFLAGIYGHQRDHAHFLVSTAKKRNYLLVKCSCHQFVEIPQILV